MKDEGVTHNTKPHHLNGHKNMKMRIDSKAPNHFAYSVKYSGCCSVYECFLSFSFPPFLNFDTENICTKIGQQSQRNDDSVFPFFGV